MPSESDIAVAEQAVLDACRDVQVPAFGLIEQVWETDPIPPPTG
jgi:hypothetical protein